MRRGRRLKGTGSLNNVSSRRAGDTLSYPLDRGAGEVSGGAELPIPLGGAASAVDSGKRGGPCGGGRAAGSLNEGDSILPGVSSVLAPESLCSPPDDLPDIFIENEGDEVPDDMLDVSGDGAARSSRRTEDFALPHAGITCQQSEDDTVPNQRPADVEGETGPLGVSHTPLSPCASVFDCVEELYDYLLLRGAKQWTEDQYDMVRPGFNLASPVPLPSLSAIRRASTERVAP